MAVLITGVAGFIGYHSALRLLRDGKTVYGIDNLNSYYDVGLKEARLAQLKAPPNFHFTKLDITAKDAVQNFIAGVPEKIDHILHLAAQAGVRYSLENPQAYIDANVTGQLAMLEAARNLPGLKHFVYASSSSVYGSSAKVPFSVKDAADQPISMYAASKRASELMTQTYAHLYRLPATGLRFFTAYGPWGRPDMAAYLFAQQITANTPVTLFNYGNMQRDFTYIDDVVDGIMAALARPPTVKDGETPHRIYNLGNSHPKKLTDFVALVEQALGMKASYDLQPLQPGDISITCADIEESRRDLGFEPKVDIEEGVPRFISWYKNYHQK